jgi:hypothetical protein
MRVYELQSDISRFLKTLNHVARATQWSCIAAAGCPYPELMAFFGRAVGQMPAGSTQARARMRFLPGIKGLKNEIGLSF